MFRWLCCLLFFLGLMLQAQTATPEMPPAMETQALVPHLTIKGAIGPAISDYLVREINQANNDPKVPLILLTLDTPGGLSASLRDINKSILSSDVPIACLVYPQGARAASAGTSAPKAAPPEAPRSAIARPKRISEITVANTPW